MPLKMYCSTPGKVPPLHVLLVNKAGQIEETSFESCKLKGVVYEPGEILQEGEK